MLGFGGFGLSYAQAFFLSGVARRWVDRTKKKRSEPTLSARSFRKCSGLEFDKLGYKPRIIFR